MESARITAHTPLQWPEQRQTEKVGEHKRPAPIAGTVFDIAIGAARAGWIVMGVVEAIVATAPTGEHFHGVVTSFIRDDNAEPTIGDHIGPIDARKTVLKHMRWTSFGSQQAGDDLSVGMVERSIDAAHVQISRLPDSGARLRTLISIEQEQVATAIAG